MISCCKPKQCQNWLVTHFENWLKFKNENKPMFSTLSDGINAIIHVLIYFKKKIQYKYNSKSYIFSG